MVTYPKNWKVKKISALATIKTGSRDTQDNKPNGDIHFLCDLRLLNILIYMTLTVRPY